MTTAFVLGNGLSRKELNLETLRPYGTIYGCNALYRDFAPDVLVATDTAIGQSIQHSGYALANCFYTRKPLPDLGARFIPEECWTYSSGPVAAYLAASNNHSPVYLLGFDMGPTSTGHFNNIYADTEFYKKSSAVPTYTGNWIDQIASISKKFANIQFIRVVGPTTADIAALSSLHNLVNQPISEFQKTYK